MSSLKILNLKIKSKKNQSGFVAAEFLFSFVLVISCGLVIFALTFSLMTVEVAQYITWSAARSYSAGNMSKQASEAAAVDKFKNLSKSFPLLTNSDSNWFSLTQLGVGGSAGSGLANLDRENRLGSETRHPWFGFSTSLELKLFKSLRIPFLGKVVDDDQAFTFPLRAFILRNPSHEECQQFIKDKFNVIKGLSDFKNVGGSSSSYVPNEDNGC